MHRSSVWIALAAAFAVSPVAVAAVSPEALRDAAQADNEAWELLSDLTTTVGPRMAGSPGDARAVAWAQAQLKRLGFDRVWIEPVTAARWRRGREHAEVLGEFAQPLHLTAIGSSAGTGSKPLQAEVLRLPDYAALQKATEEQLAGKIVFIDFRMQRARDGAGYSPAVQARYCGPQYAAEKRAAALLIRSVGTDSDRFPHTGNSRVVTGATPIPAAALSNPDADQLARLLDRGPVRLSLELDVGLDGEYQSANVIGEITGRESPDETVIIGGHLDSWDLGTGAIDDGAGIAISFAAGARIAALPQRPRRSIRVVAFAAEELGLIGGKAYAAKNGATKPRHVLGAESDFGAGRIYALRAGVPDAQWSAIESIGRVLAPLNIELQRGVGSPDSDIGPLRDLGVPWAQLAQDGTDYFDLHHTANDTLDKVDPAALDQQVAAYAVLAWMAAEQETAFAPIEPKAEEPACPIL